MERKVNVENQGKPLSPGQRQIVADEIRKAPHLTDNELAQLVEPKIKRLVDRATIQRIRKQHGIPSRKAALADMRTPLNDRERERLRTLLDRMFVPDLAECRWKSGEVSTGLVVWSCGRGRLYEYRKRDRVSRLWLSDNEEAELMDLLRGHMGATAGSWTTTRYRRLAAVVARHLGLVRGHDHSFLEGIKPDSLIDVQGYLDSGLNPGPKASATEPFKLVRRHPRLKARVDEFVARALTDLRI